MLRKPSAFTAILQARHYLTLQSRASFHSPCYARRLSASLAAASVLLTYARRRPSKNYRDSDVVTTIHQRLSDASSRRLPLARYSPLLYNAIYHRKRRMIFGL